MKNELSAKVVLQCDASDSYLCPHRVCKIVMLQEAIIYCFELGGVMTGDLSMYSRTALPVTPWRGQELSRVGKHLQETEAMSSPSKSGT